MVDVVSIAQSILDCADDAALQILSLAPELPPVTVDTPVTEARRSYIRLAGMLHPDKLKGKLEKATEVFQKLVRAFEKVADPKYRKALMVQQAKEKKKNKGSAAAREHKAAGTKQKVETKTLLDTDDTRTRKRTNKGLSVNRKTKESVHDDFIVHDSEDDYEDVEEEDFGNNDNDSEFDKYFFQSTVPPPVSSNRAMIGTPRVGGIYIRTVVQCPQCRTTWEPDSKQQYSLFMGPAGKKIHCETCLCRFGCATAFHACPHCKCAFDYDATMYDSQIDCTRCKKVFGFPYYPVNQNLIDLVRLEEWRERVERESALERTQRANRRHREASEEQNELHTLVGTCIVEEKCPLCKAPVTSRHRRHVEGCMKKSPADRAASGRDLLPREDKAKKTPRTREPKAVVTVKSAVNPKRTKASKTITTNKSAKTVRKKRARSESTSSESEEEFFSESSSSYDS
uniref:WGS project CAEQ00000000 data, annotated contig 1297 n=1 Tax=Trypanosoma congolense (strain IL3000) TaxID=1068625 RepID=F9W593_TRYCI|nr:unnamed protein product [Trypanosoma congolense IL3000]